MDLYTRAAAMVQPPCCWDRASACASQDAWLFFHSSAFPFVLTVFQRGRVDLSTGRARPGPVEGLDHHPVLGKLLEVVQGVHLAVPGRLHLHDAVLAVAARAVFPVADLVASDDPILQLLLRSLRGTLLPS